MGLFGKKKQEAAPCSCGGNCAHGCAASNDMSVNAAVKILGSGCAKCNALEDATREALVELGMDPSIEHVTDFAKIAAYGVMTTPALVVNDKVISYGKVLKKDEVIALLRQSEG